MKFKKRRLPYRIYKTGNSNMWTYEYTWEDYEVLIDKTPHTFISFKELILRNFIWLYFIRHPEKLLEWDKAKSMDISQIRNMIINHKF